MRFLETADQLQQLADAHQGEWICDTETDGLEVRGPMSRDKAWIVGLLPHGTESVLFIDCRNPEWQKMKSIMERMALVGHNLRFDIHAMNIRPVDWWCDTMLAVYTQDTRRRKSLDDLARDFGKTKIATIPELKGKKGNQNSIHLLTPGLHRWNAKLLEYLADDLIVTSQLWEKYKRAHHPLSGKVEWAVQRMEDRGVRLLEDRLHQLALEIRPLVADSWAVIERHGFTGNLNSPKQVLEFLQSKGYKFRGTNTQTVLRPHFDRTGDELIGAILMYRAWNKKDRDFCQTLPKFVQPDGLIHGGIKTARTGTGRFAHAEPNLGQIPKQGKTDQERKIAKRFRGRFQGASGGCSGADFSQVELRVAAALSNDERMLQAFAEGADPHAATAAATSGCSIDNLPDGERFKAKAVNFGILNGMGAGRLALQINTSVEEARRFIDQHRKAHPELHNWMNLVSKITQGSSSASALDGTRRVYQRWELDRLTSAVSQEVQGTAAALMKHALVACEEAGLRPILSVHDELVGDVLDKGDEYATIMREAANAAFPDSRLNQVDFVAEGGHGETWADV